MAKKIELDMNYFIERVKVDKNGCWNWQLYKDNKGVWEISLNLDWEKRKYKAPRLIYELMNWKINDSSKFVIHKCGNNACCNPKHLKIGNAKDLYEINNSFWKITKVVPQYWNNYTWKKVMVEWKIFNSLTDAWKYLGVSDNAVKKRIETNKIWYKYM